MRLLCVRCRTERIDTGLRSFFLCEPCAAALREQAFNQNPPSSWDIRVTSYCALCNEERPLRLYQWFLCPYCDRLVNSYRLGRVSQAFAVAQWELLVAPHAPAIALEVVDAVTLSPYERRSGKRELAETLDLRARENGAPVSWFELKTGQRSIAELATFQLDHSDCDDIINVVRVSSLPAFVLHVQLGREYRPPSVRVVTYGIWWSDIYAMSEAFVKSERRRLNGGKMAAHFSPACFAPLDSLGRALRDGRHRALRERLNREGPPRMYRLSAAAP